MSSEQLHEAAEKLSSKAIDIHRAIASMREELDAIDWYQQRIEATEDEELKRILAFNRDEEKEHFSMLLEWLRRNDEALDGFLRKHLFTSGGIAERAEAEEAHRAARIAPAPTVGSLKGR